ncbi:MAG: hypothetical protein HZA94_01170 [Candidatus Vogelbacteria bacterium]|nr:hypothetical protein [Candidatus Vogelbacteria bacterium]
MIEEPKFKQGLTKKSDRLNELPGKELEVERRLPRDTDMDGLANEIFEAFQKDNRTKYQIAKSLPLVAESMTRHLRYSTRDKNGKKVKLFVINIRERDGVINLIVPTQTIPNHEFLCNTMGVHNPDTL